MFSILRRRYGELDLYGFGPRVGDGQFRLVARTDSGRTRDTGWFENVITNQGLDRIGSQTDDTFIPTYISVGTGNESPAVTDTVLQTKIAHTNAVISTNNTYLNTSPYHITVEVARRFNQGAVVGILAEVGAGWDGTNLFSRALIKDGSGTPITFTVEAIDQLDVFYKFRFYPPLTDGSFSFDVSGTTITGASRAVQLSTAGDPASWGRHTWPGPGYRWSPAVTHIHPQLSYIEYYGLAYNQGSLGPVTAAHPTGYTESADLPPHAFEGSYVPGSYYRDGRLTLGIDQANLPGTYIRGIKLANRLGIFQFVWDNGIMKDNTRNFTLVYRLYWNRYVP